MSIDKNVVRNIVQKDDEMYVDVSTMKAFKASHSAADALTWVFTNSGTRLKPSKELYEDIGEPEMVDVLMDNHNIVIFKGKSIRVAGGRIIYDSKLATDLAGMAGVEVKKCGSAKAGTYHLQENEDGKIIAVIRFI